MCPSNEICCIESPLPIIRKCYNRSLSLIYCLIIYLVSDRLAKLDNSWTIVKRKCSCSTFTAMWSTVLLCLCCKHERKLFAFLRGKGQRAIGKQVGIPYYQPAKTVSMFSFACFVATALSPPADQKNVILWTSEFFCLEGATGRTSHERTEKRGHVHSCKILVEGKLEPETRKVKFCSFQL